MPTRPCLPKHGKYNRDVDPTVIRIAHGTAEIRISEMKNEFVRTAIKRCRIGDHEFDPYLILVILSDWASIPCHNAFAAECDVDQFVLSSFGRLNSFTRNLASRSIHAARLPLESSQAWVGSFPGRF